MYQIFGSILGILLSALAIAVFAYIVIFMFNNIGGIFAVIAGIAFLYLAWKGLAYLMRSGFNVYANREQHIRAFSQMDKGSKICLISIAFFLLAAAIAGLLN